MTEKLQAILEAEGLSALLGKFNDQGVTDSILGDLTDSDLKELGIDKLGERKRLLAAFGKSGGDGAATVSVVEESAPQGGSSGAPSKTAATPAEATKDSPWINTLGMPFVPIPRFETRFCVWPVRVQDYEAYCMASGAKFPEIPFPQESDHPIVGVSWNDAIEFCVWLTGKERAEGKIDDKTVYRLPTDLEWSAAVGLPHEPEATPVERHLKAPGYPWGLRWPPPRNAGNYEHDRHGDPFNLLAESESQFDGVSGILANNAGWKSNDPYLEWKRQVGNRFKELHKNWLTSWKPVDNEEYTSTVGSLGGNDLGISDLGGNVWEWCMEKTPHQDSAVVRGASYAITREQQVVNVYHDYTGDGVAGAPRHIIPVENQYVYRSSYRSFNKTTALEWDIGFRPVLAN